MYRYPPETMKNLMKFMKDNLSVTKIIKQIPLINMLRIFETICFRTSNSIYLPVLWWLYGWNAQHIMFWFPRLGLCIEIKSCAVHNFIDKTLFTTHQYFCI